MGRYVYVVQHGDENLYKIGYTEATPEQRLAALQTGNPYELKLIGAFRVRSQSYEHKLHRRFEGARVIGEWFRLSEKDLREIFADTQLSILDPVEPEQPKSERYVRARKAGKGVREAARIAGYAAGVPSPKARHMWREIELKKLLKQGLHRRDRATPP